MLPLWKYSRYPIVFYSLLQNFSKTSTARECMNANPHLVLENNWTHHDYYFFHNDILLSFVRSLSVQRILRKNVASLRRRSPTLIWIWIFPPRGISNFPSPDNGGTHLWRQNFTSDIKFWRGTSNWVKNTILSQIWWILMIILAHLVIS